MAEYNVNFSIEVLTVTQNEINEMILRITVEVTGKYQAATHIDPPVWPDAEVKEYEVSRSDGEEKFIKVDRDVLVAMLGEDYLGILEDSAELKAFELDSEK